MQPLDLSAGGTGNVATKLHSAISKRATLVLHLTRRLPMIAVPDRCVRCS
jgi:hypothetical protein